ncbi:myb-like protein X-like [Dorcoceras hygrometricum]|uniref:Myb-like protein X-like n=1 Tax=Dorcoceras hygrometricum TaxID=472368 RepID=A0A2Z7BN49_9LAMI|nr:myb-like protein X-like [Dorcoceras hygrometricum]
MEFDSLTRRELQSLCKMNKIPANMTNIAMADALKSLEFVEGIEEFSQLKESESAQSSIESPAKSEVTSPYVPETGGRTTRQRTIAKQEPQTLLSMTRTRGTAKKTQAKSKEESRADAAETPAARAQPSRRRFPVASACRKMESELKECAEEDEKKGVPLTPLAMEVTSRRRGMKKETEVRRVYSTRRSARLSEKNLGISSELKNEKPEILRSDLFMKEEGENMKMNVKEVSDAVHEMSEITGVEAETSLEENKKIDGTEVSSGQKDLSYENDETNDKSNEEEKLSQKSETVDPRLEIDQSIDAGDEQLSVHCEKGSELDEERADETEPFNGGNVAMTLDESNVEEILSQSSETDEPNPEMDLHIDAGVEQSVPYEIESELNGEKAEETEPFIGGNVAMTLNESNDFEDADGKSGFDSTTEFTTHKDADEADLTDTIDHGVKNISLENIDDVKHDGVGEENEMNVTKEVDHGVKQASEEELVGETLCCVIEHTEIEGNKIAAEEVSESVLVSLKNSPTKHFGGLESATVHSPMHQTAYLLKEIKTCGVETEPGISNPLRFNEIDSSFTTQLKSLTPTKKSASKASSTIVKKIADVSDNKENIRSCGSKLVIAKERAKIAKGLAENIDKNKDLSELSMRKLTKMLKEKLQITNKSQDENGNKAITRPALQALPDNSLGE